MVEAEARFIVTITSGRMKNVRAKVEHSPNAVTFDARVNMMMFPVPGPPKNLNVKYRTSNNVKVEFQPPDHWGGCALTEYEVEIREKTNKGELLDWKLAARAKVGAP